MSQRNGDLSLAVRIGHPIRCIIIPDISHWQNADPTIVLRSPILGRTYFVRSHVAPGLNSPPKYKQGVLLSELDHTGKLVPMENPEVTYRGNLLGEPFFAYHCFMVLSRP